MVRKKFLNPIQFIFILWGGALTFIESGTIKYVSLSSSFYDIIMLGFGMFVLGYVFFYVGAQQFPKFYKQKKYNNIDVLVPYVCKDKLSVLIVRIFFGATVLQIIILLYNIIVITGGSLNLSLYRQLLTDGGMRPHLLYLIVFLNPFAYLLTVIVIEFTRSRYAIILAIILAILFAILATGRSNLLVVLLLTIWTLYLKNMLNIRKTLSIITLFFSFFLLIGFLQGKLVEGQFDMLLIYASDLVPNNALGLAFFNIMSYATSGIVAMSEYVLNTSPEYAFHYTATNFYKLFGSFFENLPRYGILPNAHVPFATNVYTFFFAPYADWGVWGVGLIFFSYGVVGSFLYRTFLFNQSIFNTLLLALFYTLLTLSIFHDYVFSSLFPYTILFVLLCIKVILDKIDRLRRKETLCRKQLLFYHNQRMTCAD